jgi:hypothetical protein
LETIEALQPQMERTVRDNGRLVHETALAGGYFCREALRECCDTKRRQLMTNGKTNKRKEK